MAAYKKGKNLDEQINKLKEQKDKKEQGLDYRVDNIFADEKNTGQKRETQNKGAEMVSESSPFVRKVSLDELIDMSRTAKGEKPIERSKKTPFISREKEIKVPQLERK